VTAAAPSPVAIVTGGSSGIGAAISRAMIDAGYTVISLALEAPDWTHERLHPMAVDLLDAAATKTAAVDIARRFAVTHLVHNAGVIRANLVADVRGEDLHALTQLHLGAPLLLLQAVLPLMRTAAFGRVVLLSSRAALGLETRTAYSATKAGMIGMARTWALELAPSGITVNVIAPGPIAGTKMFHDVVPEGSERERRLASSIPVRHVGRPEDVARAVMFFSDADAGFVTGQTLFVCGGASVSSVTI
jgi:NAD(P)-dependent dehydrogenase (short-subunit alcohol dehydrogenase family)